MEDKLTIYATEKEINDWFANTSNTNCGSVRFTERLEFGENENKYSVIYRHSGGISGEESIPGTLHTIQAVENYAAKLLKEAKRYGYAMDVINEICKNDWCEKNKLPSIYPENGQEIAIKYLYERDSNAHRLYDVMENMDKKRKTVPQSIVDEGADEALKYDCTKSVVRTVVENFMSYPAAPDATVYKIVCDKSMFVKLVTNTFAECKENRWKLESPMVLDSFSLKNIEKMIKEMDFNTLKQCLESEYTKAKQCFEIGTDYYGTILDKEQIDLFANDVKTLLNGQSVETEMNTAETKFLCAAGINPDSIDAFYVNFEPETVKLEGNYMRESLDKISAMYKAQNEEMKRRINNPTPEEAKAFEDNIIKPALEAIDSYDKETNYRMLSRLKQDCKYFIEHPVEKHLYFEDIDSQIDEMQKLYQSFAENDKPEWLTSEQINEFGKNMHIAKEQRTKDNEMLNTAREARVNNGHYDGRIIRFIPDEGHEHSRDFAIQQWKTEGKEHGLIKHRMFFINSEDKEKLTEGCLVSIRYKDGKGTVSLLEKTTEKQIER